MRIFLTIKFIIIISLLKSQTIYSEDFSNDWKKGAITYGGTTPSQPTDGNWSYTIVGSPDNDGGSATSWNDMAFIDGAAVMSTNGATSSTLAFRWNDVNNGSSANRVDWYSKTITGAYSSITASLSYAIGNGSSANSVWAYYQIDGGAWTSFGSSVNQSTASGTFTSSTLSCVSSIKLKVVAQTRDYNSSYVTIDNVQITGCSVVVPSVSISSTTTTITSGTSVTFTSTPTNGGSTPTYQWKNNGSNVGTNSTTYTSSSLVNGDVVTCVMTSNAACASPTTATSNSITMTVYDPSVGGTVNSDQTVLYGQNASTITLVGNNGSVIKWQYSYSSDFNPAIDVANTTNFVEGSSMGAITQTVYYRAVVQNGISPAANSYYATISVATPLPIELIYLRGNVNDKGNLIEWATGTEQNNDYFLIFWSNNGINFVPINRIPGAGNSVRTIEYQYIDETPIRGVNYYKLRQTDYDGRFEDSEIISVLSDKYITPVIMDIRNILGQKVSSDERGIVILTMCKGNTIYVVKKVNE